MLMLWRMPVTYEVIVFLILSYVILLVNRKVETKKLRLFGNLIVLLLWIAALVSLGKGVYFLAKGHGMPMRSSMMQDYKHSRFSPVKAWPQPVMLPGKGPLQQPCSEKSSGNAGFIAGTPPEPGKLPQKAK